MSPVAHALTVVLCVVAVVGLLAFVIWSRIEGFTVSHRLPRIKSRRVSAHERVRRALSASGRVTEPVRAGRWCWDWNGDTYFAFAWVWWRVPARWSMPTFRIVLLDKQVNGG